jgi:hypothetical protein
VYTLSSTSGFHDVTDRSEAMCARFALGRPPHAAAGALYDFALRSGMAPEDSLSLLQALPPVTQENICGLLAAPTHLDSLKAARAGLSPSRIALLLKLDSVHHEHPQMLSCQCQDSLAVFDLTTLGYHVFGVIRFVSSPYSSVQYLQRSPEPPTPTQLNTIRHMVQSVTLLQS